MVKSILLYLMAVLYMAAGMNHFWHPQMYLRIMPPWLPAPKFLVDLTGIMEVVFGLLLLFPKTQVFAAWGIIALLVLVFPANVQMTINYAKHHHPQLWITIVRLPLQFLLMWWAYQYTKPL
jgi:uncharacterized membrane protein